MDWLARFIFILVVSFGLTSLRATEETDKETKKALEAAAENVRRIDMKMPDLKRVSAKLSSTRRVSPAHKLRK